MANFDSIICVLDDLAPNKWRELSTEELKNQAYQNYLAGWHIDLDLTQNELTAPKVDNLVLLTDKNFPNSQVRVVAPQLGSNFIWPHTEKYGFLCLRPTLTTVCIKKRIKQHLQDALALLSYSDLEREREFKREFVAYWNQACTKNQLHKSVFSMVDPSFHDDNVFYFYNSANNSYILSESKEKLKDWLKNTGLNINDKDIAETILFNLDEPWLPNEFPNTAKLFIKNINIDILRSAVIKRNSIPVLIKTQTITGTVFVAVLLKIPNRKCLIKGFRNLTYVPNCVYINQFKNLKIERLAVERVDASWVHGRDHNVEVKTLLKSKVLLIGCGSLGSKIAKILCEAGVGELSFIDGDIFKSHNTARHLLGINSINKSKATELAISLRRKFPHLKIDIGAAVNFECLRQETLNVFEGFDLIITAGIDYEGEQAVESWRKNTKQPPILLSTWVEPYALSGHAVLIINRDNLLDRFADEKPDFHLIEWPDKMNIQIIEAGCGNTFQPHGAVDLNYTVCMATDLAIDTLLGNRDKSSISSWLGNKKKISKLGGNLVDSSLNENKYFERSWYSN